MVPSDSGPRTVYSKKTRFVLRLYRGLRDFLSGFLLLTIGVTIVETDDAVSLNKYLMQWDDLCDVGVTPVMDDEGTLKSLES